MSSTVVSLLNKHGPSLTSEIVAYLVAEGVSNAAARQRVTRAQSQYTRLAGVRLEKNTRFIYLDSQYGSPEFWKALERSFEKSGRSYWAAIVGLRARGGRCPKSLFATVCGAPIARKRQLSPERILERLSSIQLLKDVPDSDFRETTIELNPMSSVGVPEARSNAILIAENVALQAVLEYARKIGFGSFNQFNLRGNETPPIVSGVQWDLSAPSYIRPLVSKSGAGLKPGFFVCDINLNEPIGLDAVKVFIRKHDMASAPAAVAPIMPFLIGDVFTDEGFSLARKSGIIATTISHLFGVDVAKALRDLIGLLANMGATVAVNPEHLYRVMAVLTKIEGAANNLRGDLFGLAVGALVRDVEDGFLLTGEKKTDFETGRKAEIDVLLDDKKAPVLVIECKSKIPGTRVSQDEVKKWYSDRVPLIHKILSVESRYYEREFRFELWTNGLFDDDAEKWLKKQKRKFAGYSVGWKNGKKMQSYARKAQSSSIRKILNEHYFKHPLAKLS